MNDGLIDIIRDISKRIESLEKRQNINEVTIPTGGKLVVDSLAADPTATTGRIYYNTVSNKFKVCENGAWKTITTT